MAAAANTNGVTERVRAGATLLDSTVPGWAGKVDVERLNMSSCVGCILGQTFAHEIDGDGYEFGYEAGCRILDIGEGTFSQAAAFGFHADSAGMDEENFHSLTFDEREELIDKWASQQYPALRTAWLAEIAARLAPAAVEDETDLSPVAVEDSPL